MKRLYNIYSCLQRLYTDHFLETINTYVLRLTIHVCRSYIYSCIQRLYTPVRRVYIYIHVEAIYSFLQRLYTPVCRGYIYMCLEAIYTKYTCVQELCIAVFRDYIIYTPVCRSYVYCCVEVFFGYFLVGSKHLSNRAQYQICEYFLVFGSI